MKKILKKILITLSILFASFSTASLIVNPMYANADGFEGRKECPSFLGLTSWDCGVEIKDEATLKTGIWQIVANIATDITVIAAYLILGYVIYGGYLYIFSQGEPTRAANAKKTLKRAFLGFAIVMSANLIMGSIRIALVGDTGNIAACASEGGCGVSADDMIFNLINWFISIAGVVSVIFIVYGGVLYITSAGDSNKIQTAKNMIMYALIGLVIVALSATITAFVSTAVRDANKNAFLINNTIISKEVYDIKTY